MSQQEQKTKRQGGITAPRLKGRYAYRPTWRAPASLRCARQQPWLHPAFATLRVTQASRGPGALWHPSLGQSLVAYHLAAPPLLLREEKEKKEEEEEE